MDQPHAEIIKLKKRVSDFVSNYRSLPNVSQEDRTILQNLERLLRDDSFGNDPFAAYDKFESDISFIFALEHKRTIIKQQVVKVQKTGWFRGDYVEESLQNVEEEVIVEPSIKKPLGFLLGQIRSDCSAYRLSLEPKVEPAKATEGPNLTDLMKKMEDMALQHQSESARTQGLLNKAGEALDKVNGQLGYMVEAAAQAMGALPSMARQAAIQAAGGENSSFAIAIRDKMHASNTEDSTPKNNLDKLLTTVYNATPTSDTSNARFRIRYVQLLLKLFPRTRFLSDIAKNAREFFSAAGIECGQFDLVDGHLLDCQDKQEQLDQSHLAQSELSDFRDFAQKADFGFTEEDTISFGGIDPAITSNLEAVEKKIRLQFLRNIERQHMHQWLGPKEKAVRALLNVYEHGKPSDNEKSFIKYLLFYLLLHKNTQTTKSVIENSKKHFDAVIISEGLKDCLADLENIEEALTGKELSSLEAEMFSVMLSGRPNLLLRDDTAAKNAFGSLFSTSSHTVEAMVAAYEQSFAKKLAASAQKAPRQNGLMPEPKITPAAKPLADAVQHNAFAK